MLILSRKPGQKLHIGEGIVVSILNVKGRRVVIGVEADKECRIRRGEIPKLTDDELSSN